MTTTTRRLRIGDLAAQAGVTPKAIRYYEVIGLLPTPMRAENGYRQYGVVDLGRLVFIQRAKALGLTLEEIRALVAVAEHGQCAATRIELQELLQHKITECAQRINDLSMLLATLEDAAGRIDPSGADSAACCPSCAAFALTCGCVPESRRPTT